MRTPTVLPAFLIAAVASACMAGAPVAQNDVPASTTPQSSIDELVFRRLKELGIQPAEPCTDEVFLRRAYLDVIGTLPTSKEAKQFLADQSPIKRVVLIDRLLNRDEFADYWAMKWGDLLRVKAEFPINLWPNAANAYYRWVRTSVKENMPYDRFARDLLTASGSNFRVAQVNFYRALQSKEPDAIARNVALVLMGERAEKWDKARLQGMAEFFAKVGYKSTREWKEEIVYFDPNKGVKEGAQPTPKTAVFPDGTSVVLPPDKDPREVFADWLIAPKNPWFTRNIVNRLWGWLVGRGIIHEPDDIRPDNPARHPDVLVLLQQELVASKYDMRRIYRLILNSKTYQLSSVPKTKHPDGEAYFASYPVRRLDAEVLIDALCQITGTTEEYSSAIPEPFTFIPTDRRSIALPDGSITSSFLEMFGRPPRDTGLESERNNNPSPAQRLHLLNSSHVRRKIDNSTKLRPLLTASKANLESAVRELYITILSRFPTDEEQATFKAYADSGKVNWPDSLVDLAWALLNSTEFLYRH